MAILVYSRRRYDSFSHFRPLYTSNLPGYWRVSHLKTRKIHEHLASLCFQSWPSYAQSNTASAECGTGKTLISLGAMFVHSGGKPFTALVMAPPQLTLKWCRETLLTLLRVRVFLIDGVRNGVGSNGHTGLNEVRLRHLPGLQNTLICSRLCARNRSEVPPPTEAFRACHPSSTFGDALLHLRQRPGTLCSIHSPASRGGKIKHCPSKNRRNTPYGIVWQNRFHRRMDTKRKVGRADSQAGFGVRFGVHFSTKRGRFGGFQRL
jgi:hypothetical protein